MNDLRERANPDAHAIDPRVLRADELRTVPMPELRTPQARALDAQARGLYDTRTEDERLLAELVRIVDALQALTLRLELVEGEQARVIAELTAYIRDHSEGEE